MTLFLRLPLITLVAWLGAGAASAGVAGQDPVRVGVIVDTTRGPDAAAVGAARADVRRLRAAGVEAELRITHSPSESLAAAATLATRGAATLVVRDVDPESVLAPV